MHSPLPDASTLEAGILEDQRPISHGVISSRVQDNVRYLLRASVMSSIRGSTIAPSMNAPVQPPMSRQQQSTVEDESRSPLQSPHQQHVHISPLPSPSSQVTATSSSTASTAETGSGAAPGVLFPPVAYQQQVQDMAHLSTMFNTRAMAALHDADLSDPSLAVLLQQKTENRQKRAWKRSRNRKLRHAGKARRSKIAWVLCLVAGGLLMGIIATYLALATSSKVSTTFHVIFILGILLATIVFAHTLVRLCFFRTLVPGSPCIYIVSDGRLRGYRRHRQRSHGRQQGHQHREMPTVAEEGRDFVPPAPIPVHMLADEEVRPDSREAEPAEFAERTSRAWDKDVEVLPNPPPAYGRWRGSVRANPDLLHWQPMPCPGDPTTPAMPSPTYEEAMRAAIREAEGQNEVVSEPPKYVTGESRAR